MLKFPLLCLILVNYIEAEFDLTVLHVNDIHVRIEETNKYSGNCKQKDKQSDDGCFGGIPRLVSAVNQFRNADPNTIFLNGGDFYQGNVYYTHFKWRVVARFANLLNFTAMAPGNHEFDDHVPGFVPFVKNASFPIVCANIDVSEEPTLKGLIPPSVTIDIGGKKVGIIGYVTTDTTSISNPDNVRFLDEVETIKEEAAKLKSSGVDILIALGHSGYERDQDIARGVPDIDLVVGGHSHSLLYTGPKPSVEKPSGPYPTLVQQPDTGRTVPVVQAYAYTKYLGRFKMSFNDDGEMTKWEGKPVLLDKTIPQDETVLTALKPWKAEIESFSEQTIAYSNVLLLERRGEETNLGNFIADSMVDYYSQRTHTNLSWNEVPIGIMNSGGIRGSFEHGDITMADLMTVLPFENSVDRFQLRGRHLKELLESVAAKIKPLDDKEKSPGFLQVSGIRAVFDMRKPKGQRVVELKLRCSRCKIPRYYPLEPESLYSIAAVSYLLSGGDGNSFLAKEKLNHVQGPLDTDVFKTYAEKMSPITQGVEDRIVVLREDHVDRECEAQSSATWIGNYASVLMLISCSFIITTVM